MKKNLKSEVNLIYDYLSSWDSIKEIRNTNHIGLLSGLPGVILSLSEYSDDESKKDYFKTYIEKTFDIVNKADHLTPTFCDGLAGYGFFLLQLKEENLLKNDSELENDINEVLEEVDEILIPQVEELYSHGNFDILHGLLGIGFYFLKRDNISMVMKVVNIIIEDACKSEDGYIFWKKYDGYDRFATVIDLGNAHGIGANIFFLTKVLTKDYIEDFVKSRITTIIDNAIQFFLKYEQQINEKIFSFYPVKMEYEDYVNKNIVIQNSRLGWCYGDLGILYTLLFASKKIHNESYVSKIVEMLKHVASRKFEDENHKKFIIDAGFCHGTSGIAILFRNIYDITGDDLFLKTSNYWIEKTLVQRKKEQGEDSIDYGLDIKGTDKQNISVLEGLAGILLCYNKFLGKDTTASEELLMIKY